MAPDGGERTAESALDIMIRMGPGSLPGSGAGPPAKTSLSWPDLSTARQICGVLDTLPGQFSFQAHQHAAGTQHRANNPHGTSSKERLCILAPWGTNSSLEVQGLIITILMCYCTDMAPPRDVLLFQPHVQAIQLDTPPTPRPSPVRCVFPDSVLGTQWLALGPVPGRGPWPLLPVPCNILLALPPDAPVRIRSGCLLGLVPMPCCSNFMTLDRSATDRPSWTTLGALL